MLKSGVLPSTSQRVRNDYMKISDIKLEIDKIKTLADLTASPFHEDERKGVQSALNRRARLLQKERALLEHYDTMMRHENEHPAASLAGVDEAGRGPLAGDVVAAAVILPDDYKIIGLDDSKKVPESKRLALREEIMEHAEYGIGIATAAEIDKHNIYEATKIAMQRAIDNLPRTPDHLLIDAMTLGNNIPQTSLIKGDAVSNSIAAASIIAKTTRDLMMAEYEAEYPDYGFLKHKGYGTKAHLEALHKYGATPIHRKTFEPVKSMTGGQI